MICPYCGAELFYQQIQKTSDTAEGETRYCKNHCHECDTDYFTVEKWELVSENYLNDNEEN